MNEYLFNLQLFADGDEPGADQKPTETPTTVNEPDGDGKSAPKYTDADLDRIINQKFAAWQKQQEKKVSEAERLSKMTAEEKANEKFNALQKQLDEYIRKDAISAMTKEARAMLSDKNIHVDDALLANLIGEDAETTKASVESFISLFNAAVEKAVKDKVKGDTPITGNPTGMTKEQILKVTNRAERQRLMAEHKDLFM